MLNVAVIGCGKHFEYFHLKSFKRLSKNFNIHGIYDVDYKRSKKIQKKYRIKKSGHLRLLNEAHFGPSERFFWRGGSLSDLKLNVDFFYLNQGLGIRS